MEEATYQAGAREVFLIEEPIAAAIGSGIDITRPCGSMVVDIGGGTTDIAIISLGGTVVSQSVRLAGNDFDEAIIRYVRKAHNLFIGEQTAEAVKIRLGSVYPRPQTETMEIKGRNVITGLPKTAVLTSEEIREALKDVMGQILEAVSYTHLNSAASRKCFSSGDSGGGYPGCLRGLFSDQCSYYEEKRILRKGRAGKYHRKQKTGADDILESAPVFC